MQRLKTWILLLAAAALLAACAAPVPLSANPTPTAAATSTPLPATVTPTPGIGADELPPFTTALQRFALDKYNAKPEEVKLVKMEAVDWPDSCLGAAQPGDICAQVVTPGYKLQVMIKGKTYELHSDAGQIVRMPPPPAASAEINPAAEVARLWLMDKLKVESSAIRVLSVVEEDWPDGCLGVHKPETMCTSVIVPGYRVTLESGGANYEIRTSRDGKAIVLADPVFQYTNPKSPVLEHPQLTWKITTPDCRVMQASDDQVAYGACGGALKIVRLSNPERIKELAALILLYHPFNGQTVAGEVNFYGGGTGDAAPSQQRALAEWAQLVYQEVIAGAVQPGAGLVLTWHRVGGIAGFCDNLQIYRSGLFVTSTCKSGVYTVTGSRWLTAEQLDPLFVWLDTFKTTDWVQSDNAVADSMKITWTLTAAGAHSASVSEIQAIQDYAALVYSTKP
jgi:hypothetical protein